MATLEALKGHLESKFARASNEANRNLISLATELSLEVDVLVKQPIKRVADILQSSRRNLPDNSPVLSRLDATIALLEQLPADMYAAYPLEALNYIDPQAQDLLLTDIHEGTLRKDVAYELGVEYLSLATAQPSFPVRGFMYSDNERLFTNLVVRKGDVAINVFFIIDTASPHTYLCTSAMQALGFKDDVPASTMIQCHGVFVQACLSPPAGRFSDVNVLGANFMRRARARLVADFRSKELIIEQLA
jgi:hypothetical protein